MVESHLRQIGRLFELDTSKQFSAFISRIDSHKICKMVNTRIDVLYKKIYYSACCICEMSVY